MSFGAYYINLASPDVAHRFPFSLNWIYVVNLAKPKEIYDATRMLPPTCS